MGSPYAAADFMRRETGGRIWKDSYEALLIIDPQKETTIQGEAGRRIKAKIKSLYAIVRATADGNGLRTPGVLRICF